LNVYAVAGAVVVAKVVGAAEVVVLIAVVAVVDHITVQTLLDAALTFSPLESFTVERSIL